MGSVKIFNRVNMELVNYKSRLISMRFNHSFFIIYLNNCLIRTKPSIRSSISFFTLAINYELGEINSNGSK